MKKIKFKIKTLVELVNLKNFFCILEMKKQYFIECHSKIVSDCLQKGKSFES